MNRVRVRAKCAGGFWRAGRQWPTNWTVADVDDGVLAAINAEPMLVVEAASATDKPPQPPASISRDDHDRELRRCVEYFTKRIDVLETDLAKANAELAEARSAATAANNDLGKVRAELEASKLDVPAPASKLDVPAAPAEPSKPEDVKPKAKGSKG